MSSFGLRPLLRPFEHDAAAEEHRPMAFVDLAQARDRRVVGGDGVGVVLLAAQQVGQRERCVDAVGLLRNQRLQAADRLVEAVELGIERRRPAGAPASESGEVGPTLASAAIALGICWNCS